MPTFRCTIVTPSEAVFNEEVSYASIPSWDGQLGVMNGQSPLLTRLGIGAMHVDRDGGERTTYWIDGGFAQVQRDKLTILTERACMPDALVASDAETELREANAAAVSGSGTRPEDRRKAEDAQQRARSKLALARN